jgi:hypothetical protein
VRACAAGASCTADKCRVITTPSPTPTPKHPKYKACVAKPGEPGVVAYYEDGRHEIAGRPNILHLGKDVVLKVVRGFEQCFMGTADGKPSSVYSYWRNVGKAESCPNGQILVKNAYPQWGDHMEPGANYCVRNVDL